MFLSQTQIEQAVKSGELSIAPFNPANLKLANYTFTLGSLDGHHLESLDGTHLVLEPGEFILGQTDERLNLNNKFVCILSNRGSVAKQGIDALGTDIVCEPDTNGNITLNISNGSREPVILRHKMLIVKDLFSRIDE